MAAFGSRGAGYGLDAELCRQREAKYDYDAEDSARAWIEAVTNEPVKGLFGDALRNGVLLCKLVNTIKPGAVRRVNESRMPFKQMENISNFLKSCRALGVAEHSLFETVDLFEGKDIGLVVRCVFSLGSAVQLTCPEYTGPSLGAKLHQANKRVFNEQQKQQARVNSSFSKMTMGSAHIMERPPIPNTGITFGAVSAGKGDTTTMGKLTKGSHGIQERLPLDIFNNMTFGRDAVGTGDTTVISKASSPAALGSFGIMDRNSFSNANDITFGASASQGTPLDKKAYEAHASKETVAEPAVKQAAADCSVAKHMTPLLFGSDVVENNRNWFQSRSG
ncbi:unnamed protein product [Pylaiella littoralis]